MRFYLRPPLRANINETVFAIDTGEYGVITKIRRYPYWRLYGHYDAIIEPKYQIKTSHGYSWVTVPVKCDYKSVDEIEFIDLVLSATLNGLYCPVECENGDFITIQDPSLIKKFPDGEDIHRIHVFPSEIDFYNWNNAAVVSVFNPHYIVNERNHRVMDSAELQCVNDCIKANWKHMLSEYHHLPDNTPVPDISRIND